MLRSLPLRQGSRLWGQLHSQDLPEWLRVPAFSLYIKMYGCKLEEAIEQDLTKYANLCQFFQRLLIPGVRPISGTHCLVRVYYVIHSLKYRFDMMMLKINYLSLCH